MKTIAIAATGVFLVGAVAQAETGGVAVPGGLPPAEEVNPTIDPANPAGPNPSTYTPTVQAVGLSPWVSRLGGAVMAGGGFEDFTNSNIRGMTGGGGAWTARVVGGTRQLVGVEAAYIGASRSINGFGLGNDTNLMSQGVEGVARLNFPVPAGRSTFVPFAFVGLGWQHYSLMNGPSVNVSALSNSDDVMTLPYGAGIDFSYGMFIADARFTYRYTYMNDLMRASGGRLNNYGAALQVGVEF